MWTLAGLVLINWSIQLLGASTSFAWVGALVVLSGAWGLATVISSWLPIERVRFVERSRALLAWVTALLVIASMAAWCFVQVRQAPGYGTDEIAFDQYAAVLVQHGLNPYTHSMAPSFSLYRVPPDGFTYTMAGKAVTSISYPALAFLLYVPLLALGLTTQLAVVVNVIAWCLAILILFALLPRRMRALGLVIGSTSAYVGYAVGGVTDALYIPLLIGAAYRWNRFGSGRATYLGPVMLGLAMAIKQTPWLIFVFVLLGLFAESLNAAGPRPALRRIASYAAIALGVFLLPNLPYIFADAGAWLHGVFLPIVDHLVPAGQGTVALSMFDKLGGGSLVAFSVTSALMGLVAAALYAGTYPLLRPVTFILPAVVLFFATRSYGSYLVALIPAALVGAFTTGLPVARFASGDGGVRWATRSRTWRASLGLTTTALLAAIVWALAASPPVSVRITGIRSTGQLATIEQVTVEVTNRADHPLSPAFTLDEGGAITTFWPVSAGPSSLRPGESASYTLQAPNFPAQPSIDGGFSVLALTRSPDTVAASGPYAPAALHVGLTPDAVNTQVPAGTAVLIRAELLDRIDRRVHRAGVAISLGQIIYDQGGLQASEARVNQSPPGQTPVSAYTDSDGVASFSIVDGTPSAHPIYFEANLVRDRSYLPYGYSEILPIRFG